MDIRIVKLSDIREELQGHLKRQELFPIIGSGFTKGCETKYGKGYLVPSGEDMKQYMEDYLATHGQAAPKGLPFSKIAHYYENKANKDDVCTYFKQHFLGVKLQDLRKEFLGIDWKLIYTLNLDDAIEKNSPYNMTLLPNRNFQLDAISDQKCVFKLHGDAEAFIKYGDEENLVLSITSYIKSLYKNQAMLDKLKTDLEYSNTLFIGCSLNDELDILSLAQELKEGDTSNHRNRYFVTDKKPNSFQEIDLKDCLIDTVILVNSYDSFYREFVKLANECGDLTQEMTSEFYNLQCKDAPQKKDLDYLLYGKFLLDRKRKAVFFPDFFIERDIQSDILSDMKNIQIQIIHGSRVSGKSYLLAGLLRNIHNRDTYYFDSREQVSASLLEDLLSKKQSVLLFDTNVLSLDAIHLLIKSDCSQMKKRGINVVCCVNNSDRDVLEMVGYETQHLNKSDIHIQPYELSGRFSTGKELNAINSKLKLAGQLPFTSNQTILDNLLNIQRQLRIKQPDQFDAPIEIEQGEVEKLCLLILLALNEKVTAEKLIQCGLRYKSKELLQDLKVTIEEDHRNLLTLNTIESVSYQIVCNAKVWLLNQVRELGRNLTLEGTIVDAFKKLVNDFLGNTTKYKKVEMLVKFDKLNEIFPDGKRLILKIYEGLTPVLMNSYQYYHQYAKCHLWGMSKAGYDLKELNKASTAAHTALIMVEDDLNPTKASLHTSYAHILNTLTIIYTKLCLIENFQNASTVEETIDYFFKALSCTENYSAMCQAKGKGKTSKEEEGGVLNRWISRVVSRRDIIPVNVSNQFSELLKMWKNLEARY